MTEDLKTKPIVETARWKVVIYYRSDVVGFVDVEHGLEELDELHDIVERGPDWNAINKIVVTLDRVTHDDLTIEQAGQL